jgi:hypothetical protein
MSSYREYTHIQNNYVFDKLIVGAVANNKSFVFVCDKPNCDSEWEEICYCIDNGKVVDISELK